MNFRLPLGLAVALLLTGCANFVFEPMPGGPTPERAPGAPPKSPAPVPPPSEKSGASGGAGRRTPPTPTPQSPAAPQSPRPPQPAPTTPAPQRPADIGGAVGDAIRRNRGADRLVLRDANRTVLEFQSRPWLPAGVPEIYRRGGYIAKVMTPSGRVITDDFAPKHIHHHGIWAAWTKTVFEGRQPDFWNMGDGKGRVEYLSLDVNTPTQVRSRQRYVDMTVKPEKAALEETFEVHLRPSLGGARPANVFDVTLTQNCLTAAPLQLPEYRYGGLGFRGHRDWDGVGNCQFLTSEGITDRVQAHATKARWCHISGMVAGKRAGVAILCHPGNFRAPQPVRVHPDEPFFCYAPPLGGDFSILPGKPYTARYRFIAFDGEPDRAWIEQLWKDYAAGK